MNELIVKGKQEFLGKQVPIIKGGFGEDQKCVLARDIALIHEVEVRKVNELINNNLDEFEQDVDLIDLKGSKDLEILAKDEGFITSNSQKYCYLLSEQGYIALVGLMRTPKAKEIRKKFRREYFLMKDAIETVSKENTEVSLKANELINKIDSSINEMHTSIGDLAEYYKPTHAKKLDLNRYIHNVLGTNYTRKNSDRVKEIVLTMLGSYKTWESVPKDVLSSEHTYKLILDVGTKINVQEGQVQESMF